jgi:hypothetical protein
VREKKALRPDASKAAPCGSPRQGCVAHGVLPGHRAEEHALSFVEWVKQELNSAAIAQER